MLHCNSSLPLQLLLVIRSRFHAYTVTNLKVLVVRIYEKQSHTCSTCANRLSCYSICLVPAYQILTTEVEDMLTVAGQLLYVAVGFPVRLKTNL